MEPLFIVNPCSRHAQRALLLVHTFAAATDADLVLTTHPRQAFELATNAVTAGRTQIVAVGGDGTLNEVASALVKTSATFGLVPCGSGNGLGRYLSINGSVTLALAIIRAGHVRPIDTGLANYRPFFTAAGLGFEAVIAARFNRLVRCCFVHYLRIAASLFRTYHPETCVISGGTTCLERAVFTPAVRNSDQYGNQARDCPGSAGRRLPD